MDPTTSLSTLHKLGALVGVLLSLWAIVARLDKALVRHLAGFFVTRKQLDRLETKVDRLDSKIDTLLSRQWEARNRRRAEPDTDR